jgi:hypothetical protein
VEFGKDFHARQVKLRRHLKRYEQQFPFQQTDWHGFAAEDMEDGRELLREQEKPTIGEPPSPLSSRRSRGICSLRL